MHLELALPLPARKPLLTLSTVSTLLDLRRQAVVEACAEGTLAWAWDFATRGAQRSELRVWRGSVAAWRQTQGRDGAAHMPEAEGLAELLPGHYDPRSSEITYRWEISRDLLADLIATGEIAVARAARQSQGVNAACALQRASLVAFLQRRRAA